jgi:iron-sulfur cluster assembly protein
VLALTENATEAIEGILSAPTIPDGAGIRIAPAPRTEAAGAEGSDLNVTVATAPSESDQVVDQQGARVFVDEPLTEYLDDKLLDARVSGDQVSFLIGQQGR